MTPLTSFYRGNRQTLVKAKYVTEVLHNALHINVHRTGIEASESSERLLRADGRAMALMHIQVN
jgi:hypothetical protein